MTPKTINVEIFDRTLRHAIDLRRYTQGEVKEILALLEAAQRDLVEKLQRRLAMIGTQTSQDFTTKRLRSLLTDTQDAIKAANGGVYVKLRDDLVELAKSEMLSNGAILGSVGISFNRISVPQLRGIVTDQPFQGHLLKQWFDRLNQTTQSNLVQQLQLGLAQGESVPQLVARIAGTKAANFTDGVLATSRRNAETIVRTATNHVQNAVRTDFFDENSDLVSYLRFTATLDNRTTLICASNDGKGVPVGGKDLPDGVDPVEPEGAEPPLHPNCRSVLVAVVEGVGNKVYGSRPEKGSDGVGTVPAGTTYDTWLRTQSLEYQDEILGRQRAAEWRDNPKMTLDKFIDHSGRTKTLQELGLGNA